MNPHAKLHDIEKELRSQMIDVRLILMPEGVRIHYGTYSDLLLAKKELASRKIKLAPTHERRK